MSSRNCPKNYITFTSISGRWASIEAEMEDVSFLESISPMKERMSLI
jgi:hypothetical protein